MVRGWVPRVTRVSGGRWQQGKWGSEMRGRPRRHAAPRVIFFGRFLGQNVSFRMGVPLGVTRFEQKFKKREKAADRWLGFMNWVEWPLDLGGGVQRLFLADFFWLY